LHALIAITVETELDIFVIRKLKAKGLDSFAIGREHNQMAFVQTYVLDPDWLFVRPENRLVFLDPHA
jgi:hypothetical protein